MSNLLDRLKKASKIAYTDCLSDSTLTERTVIDTGVPAINIVFSGAIDGGYTSGVTVLCGESRTFKSVLALICAKKYLDKFPDSVLVFYDSEMGASKDYFNSVGIDPQRVLHVPIADIEELKFDIVSQLQELNRGDRAVFVIDSVGNLASKKETQDAIDEKSVADMSRAKALKSLFRLITPQLNFKDLPCICISHTYKSIGSFIPTDVLSGGCLIKDSKIRMGDQSIKNIQDVSVGDIVQTNDGNHRVLHTWNPDTLDDGTPQCYTIEFDDGHKVTCSENHKFMIDGKWVCAKDLAVGDDLATIE